jgi:dihydrofolate synthase/folylpolyglutamate synthase
VHVHAALVDALDAAITFAEADREPIGAGVLVTGSVITAGNVRSMVRGTGAVR